VPGRGTRARGAASRTRGSAAGSSTGPTPAQRVLTRAASILSSSLEVDGTLRQLTRTVVPALADWCVVHLAEESGALALADLAHVDEARVSMARELERRWPRSAHSLLEVVRTGEPLRVERISPDRLAAAAEGDDHLQALRAFGLCSVMIVALRARDRVVGALTLATAESQRAYSAADLEVALELAGMAALAIDNARLFAEAKQARREAEAAAGVMGLLADASSALAEVLDPDLALVRLADVAVSLMADYAVTYALRDDELRRVGLAHADPGCRAAVEDLVRAGPPKLDDPFGAGAVLRTGQPVLAPRIDPELLERASQNERHLDALRRLAPRSSLIVPLRARGRAIGALALAATERSGRVYTEADLRLAESLAARTAVLIDNARLYREATEAVRARDEMVAVLAHDLRSPLTAVIAATDILSRAAPADVPRVLGVIRRSADHMGRLVGDLLDVARIDAGKLGTELALSDVGAMLSDACELVGSLAVQRGVAVTRKCEPLGLVRIDRGRLLQALTNLLVNAVKFSAPGGAVELTAQAESGLRGDVLRISVRDEGPGIPEEDCRHLFDRFWQAQRREGVGLGLTIVRGIAEAHGGTVEVDSEVGRGSTFTLVVPLRA
jgi:signal transduction histidine kinase